MTRYIAYQRVLTVGGLGAAFTVTHITHVSLADLPSEAAGFLFFGLYLLALFSALAYGLLRIVLPRLQRFSKRAQVAWLVSVPLLGAFATLVIPTFPPQPWLQEMEVTITPLNARNPAAQGSEVWLLRAFNGGQALDLAAFAHEGAWEWRDGALMALTGATAPLRWRGWVRRELTLELLMHPWSGKVRVQVGDQTQEVDLYAETAQDRRLTLTPPPSLWGQAQQGALWLADIISFGALLTAALLLAATWRPQARPFMLAWHWYALPCVVVWSLTLLVFWPGLMSADSVDQWSQMLSGRYNDAHPAFHTLTMRVLTLLWPSPAAVALAQIAAMALAFGLTLRELALLGVNRWVQAFLTVLFALSPVNNLMVITLWKDIPYAIAMLFVFWALLRVWRTDGAWLHSWRALAVIGVALAALALYRHNGAPTALLILPAFLLVGRQTRWRQVAAIGSIALVLVLIVRLGVYRVFDVAPVPSWVARQMQIHQIGAFVAYHGYFNNTDTVILESLLPLEQWKSRYSCYSVFPLLYRQPTLLESFDAHLTEFAALWQRLALRNVATLVHHQLCMTSLIWRVTQPDDGYLYTWNSELIYKGGADLGLVPASVFPGFQKAIKQWLFELERPDLIWLVWRPALYLYLTLFCVAAVSVRYRSWRLAGLALPVVAQSLIWMLLLATQDFRFQYPIYIVGLLALGLLFVPASEAAERL